MYCPDLRYENELQKKEAQHAALDGAVKNCGTEYNVITLPVIVGQYESQNHTTSYALEDVIEDQLA